MKIGERARLAGIWTAGIAGFIVLAAATVYGAWWLLEDMFLPPPPPPEPKPIHIIVGLDLSQGNPLVISDVFSTKAGRRIASMLGDLPMRSKVTLRTFGSYNVNDNPLQFDRVISRRNPADEVQRVVRGIVSGVPELIAEGRLKAQQQSNIVPFLHNMSMVANCYEADTSVILVTDGLEESEVARLDSRDGTLPPPDRPIFEGCRTLEMLGLGQGLSSVEETRRLRGLWEEWARAAGFEEFRGLNDW